MSWQALQVEINLIAVHAYWTMAIACFYGYAAVIAGFVADLDVL